MFSKLKKLLTQFIIKDESSFQACTHLALKKHVINNAQYHLINKTVESNKTPIIQAMTDKAKTITIQHSMSIDEVLSIYKESTHSRYPVINSDEEIAGVLLMKDLLSMLNENKDITLQSIIRPAHFVTETQSVLSLLNDMRSNHQHMSIVLDEYGLFQGIITIEDVLEQIVGNIEDEHDSFHPEYIISLSDNKYRAHGITPIEQFNQFFNTQVDMTEFDTISGIISKTLGHIPQKGETIQLENLTLEVHQANSTTIQKINITQHSSKDIHA